MSGDLCPSSMPTHRFPKDPDISKKAAATAKAALALTDIPLTAMPP